MIPGNYKCYSNYITNLHKSEDRYKLVYFPRFNFTHAGILDTKTRKINEFNVKNHLFMSDNNKFVDIKDYIIPVDYDIQLSRLIVMNDIKLYPPYKRIMNINYSQISLDEPKNGSGIYFRTDVNINYIKSRMWVLSGEICKYLDSEKKLYRFYLREDWVSNSEENYGHGFLKIGEIL